MVLMTVSDAVLSRRTVGLALALAVLVGCGQHVPVPPPSTDPVPPSTGPTPKNQGAALRQRLAHALRSQHPDQARLVEDALTDLTAVEAAWLPAWQVIDVSYRGVPHGRRFFVGLADDDQVSHLAGQPDTFNAMTATAGVDVRDGGTASAVAQVCLDATRTFQHYAYRVEGVGDIAWLPNPTPREEAERRRVERAYGSRLTAPAARNHGTDWALTLWTVDNRSLIEHTLVVSRAGRVSDRARTVDPHLPVPESV